MQSVSSVVSFNTQVKVRGDENRVMLKALLGSIGRPCLDDSIQHSQGTKVIQGLVNSMTIDTRC